MAIDGNGQIRQFAIDLIVDGGGASKRRSFRRLIKSRSRRLFGTDRVPVWVSWEALADGQTQRDLAKIRKRSDHNALEKAARDYVTISVRTGPLKGFKFRPQLRVEERRATLHKELAERLRLS